MLMSGRLISLDQNPEFWPVVMKNICKSLVGKCILKVLRQKSNEVCGTDQLYGEMEACIQGGIQAMRLLWQKNAQEADLFFLLIGIRNAFDEYS